MLFVILYLLIPFMLNTLARYMYYKNGGNAADIVFAGKSRHALMFFWLDMACIFSPLWPVAIICFVFTDQVIATVTLLANIAEKIDRIIERIAKR